MYRFNHYAFLSTLILILAHCPTALAAKDNSSIAGSNEMGMVVTASWLKEHLDDPDLVILDATVVVSMNENGMPVSRSGYQEYLKEHIPGARFADLMNKLSSQSSDLNNVMPTAEEFAQGLEELGVNNESRVVIYTSQRHVWGTRLWWMLAWAGHEQMAILDGGLAAWKEAGYALSENSIDYNTTEYQLNLKPSLIAEIPDVQTAITNEAIWLVDSMPEAHFNGNFSLYSRPGHIPTAINLSTNAMVDNNGYFVATDDLEMRLDASKETQIITYCGGGVAASSVAFNLLRSGYTNVSVYMGSLQEWTQDASLPMSSDPN